MMAAFILAFSLLTLLMFFVSYCRSLTASFRHMTLSRDVLDVTGIKATVSGSDYAKVMQILQLCPDRPEDRSGLQVVGTYYSFLSMLNRSVAKISPAVRNWVEAERGSCAHFAAVALGRRIAFSREMLAEQADL